MKIERVDRIGRIAAGQDGAIFGQYLFRFDTDGRGWVYALSALGEQSEPVGAVCLDPKGALIPHANSVMFGTEYFAAEDAFPALYVNVYNNYARTPRPLKGVTLVYRLTGEVEALTAHLAQVIEVGFTEDATLWKATAEADGPRPYGNCVIDHAKGRYYAFVMRNEALGTRYFGFPLPALTDGTPNAAFGARHVILRAEDILTQFDCPHHRYIQGATMKDGMIYSLEGFDAASDQPPAVRVIDTAAARELCYIRLADYGLTQEPEFIDFADGTCYYSDAHGHLYSLLWEK